MSERLLRYAEASKERTHGMKTEDELLQRIWNLARDVTTLATALDEIQEQARQGKIHSESVRVDEDWPVHETIHRFSVIRATARTALGEN